MSNSSLTICILTYNRYEHLKRLLRYYLESEYLFDLIVLDSSSFKSEDKELTILLEKTGASWKHFPEDIFFAKKLALGLSYVKTEYAVICADDDFLVPRGLLKSVNFLESNKDFISAHGIYCSHSSDTSDGIKWGVHYPLSRSNISDHSLKRFLKFFPNNYSSYPFYAVHKTSYLQAIWEKTNKCVSDWGWSEIFPSSISVILGKSKKLMTLYSSREINPSSPFDQERTENMFSDTKNNKAILGLLDIFKEVGLKEYGLREIILSQIKIYRALTSNKPIFKNSFDLYIRYPKLLLSRLVSEFLKIYIYLIERKEISKIHNLLLCYKISPDKILESRKSY
tara:strand:+ start:2705 stop:3721 length:1017 start_codon:yes stop_codon:yes gene_type:complete